jgi:hypothetical protein
LKLNIKILKLDNNLELKGREEMQILLSLRATLSSVWTHPVFIRLPGSLSRVLSGFQDNYLTTFYSFPGYSFPGYSFPGYSPED